MRAAADEVYGRSGEFREACRALSLAYVVIIPCDYRVTLARNTVIRADDAISDAVFERRSCGNGTKGPRYSDWALTATAGPREFLLIRRLPSRELRTTAIRAAISGPSAVPVTGPDTAAACQGTAVPSGENTVSAAGLQFYRHGAPLPSSGGQPCPPGIPRSGCPTPRPPASTASPATGKPGSSPPPASPSISAGQHGAGSTRPAPAGTTAAPASRPSQPDLRRTKGSDTV
jgi:hypothetical protein